MLIKHVFANFMGKSVSVILSFICTPFYLYFLGIESYGLIGVFYTLMAALGMFSFGLTSVITREMAFLEKEKQQKLLGTFECIYAALGTLVVLVFMLFPPFHLEGSLMLLMAGSIAFQLLYCLYDAALMGVQRQLLANILNSVFAILRFLGALFILWFISPTAESFFIWQLIITFFQAVIFRGFAYPKFYFSLALLKERRALLFESSGTSFLAQMITQADKVILSKLLSLEFFGYYWLATSICNAISYFVFPVTQAFYPSFSEYFASKDFKTLKESYTFGSHLIALFVLPLGLFISFFAKDILFVWTRDILIAEQACKVLILLSVAKMFEGLIQLPWVLTFAYGSRKTILYQQGISFVLLVPLLMWSTTSFGAEGASFVLVLLYASYFFIGLPFIHKEIQIAQNKIALPFLGALSICFLCKCILPPNNLLSLFTAFGLALACSFLLIPFSRKWLATKR